MKMREWLKENPTESDFSGLLDAEVIGLPCKTCGGRGKRKDIWAGAVREVACPDCADAPVWVIAPEVWEAFVCAVWSHQMDAPFRSRADFGESWDEAQTEALRTAQALLPSARVAKAVGRFRAGNRETGESAYLDTGIAIETVGDAAGLPDIEEDTPIAVLAKQGEVEE